MVCAVQAGPEQDRQLPVPAAIATSKTRNSKARMTMGRSTDLKYVGRKSAMRWLAVGIAALMLVGGASAQKTAKRVRRETNAARKARIQRTIQDTYSHRYEVFGGGGFLRFRSGEFTKKHNEVSWAVSNSYFFTPKFAVVGDARGMFGNANATINNIYGVYHPQINEYTFMGGGSYRFYAHEKTAVSVQALGGAGWGIFSGGSKGHPSTQLGLWPDGIQPAFSVGISADYNFYPNLAFRLTPTYVGTTFGNGVQNNLGLNAGFVYRFGRQK
jgi:hypothetical protein